MIIFVANSDILTNLDYEHFFLDFLSQGADFSVITIPYHVDIPYAVLETLNNEIRSFKKNQLTLIIQMEVFIL